MIKGGGWGERWHVFLLALSAKIMTVRGGWGFLYGVARYLRGAIPDSASKVKSGLVRSEIHVAH